MSRPTSIKRGAVQFTLKTKIKSMKQSKPNILFVLADQLRACSMGYAGEEAVKTPNIDAFAARSTFSKFNSASENFLLAKK